MKSRLRAVITFLAFLLFIGVASTHESRILDSAMAIFVLAIYIFGSAVLVRRTLASKTGNQTRIVFGTQLDVLPKSWRRWMLDEKEPPAHQ